MHLAGSAIHESLGKNCLGARRSAIDKAAVARVAVALWDREVEWPHDLRRQVSNLVKLIRRANDLDAG
jgi:hypothetical protein